MPVSTTFDNVFLCYQGQKTGHVNLIPQETSLNLHCLFSNIIYIYVTSFICKYQAISTSVFDRQISLMRVGPTEM